MGRQGTIDRARSGAGRPRRAALLAIAAAATCAGIVAPAQGATGTHTITVLPDTSALELSTFPRSTAVDIEVLRNGVAMAHASVTTDSAGDAAVNGGTLDCWSDATPDLLPGDVVKVTGPGFADTKAVDAITSSRPEQTGPGTVVVHGRATAPDGTPLPVASIETRVIGSAQDRFSNGRRDLRAGAGNPFPLAADAGDPGAWTATFSGLTPDDVTKVLTAIDVRGIFTDTIDPSQTIAQSPVARGPAMPCTTPVRRDAVTHASRMAVNARDAGDDLVLSGVAQDADAVTVTLDDEDPRTAPVTAPATLSAPSGGQAFTATIPGADLRMLHDGTLTASATYTVGGTDLYGGAITVLKDTVAPPAPIATPGAGTYLSAQSVALEDADATAAIHWTAGGTAPTAGSATYAAPILVTASQTLRAIAVDRAGNASPVATLPFEIAVPVVPSIGSVTAAPQGAAPAPAATPRADVAGATASALRATALTVPARVRVRTLKARGLSLSLHAPAEAAVVRVRVYRANRSGRPTGRALATVERLAPGSAATMRIGLRDRAVRRLGRGRYVVTVAVGRTRAALGPAAARALTVTR
jgi:hypothetical protein